MPPPRESRATAPAARHRERAGAAVLASLAVHASAVVGFLWLADAAGSRPTRRALTSIEVVTAAPSPARPDPVEVELVQVPSEPPPPPPATAPAPPPSAPAIEASAVAPAVQPLPPAPAAPPSSDWLKMRGPQLALSEAMIASHGDPLARPTAPDAPAATTLDPLAHLGHVDFVGKQRRGRRREAARVESAGRGTGVIRDGVTNVTVHRDGTVDFHDLPDLDLKFDIHLPTPGQIKADMSRVGRAIDRWAADPYAKAKRAGTAQDVPRHMAATPGACDQWGDSCSREIRRRDWRADRDAERQADLEENARGMVGGGKLDLTAMLMRRLTGDPYVARKRKLLDDSRDVRAELGARNKAEDLARSAEMMQDRLEKLWPTLGDPAAQREALFTLWDECAEGDGPIGEAGQRARAIVIGWIRARLPRDTPGAFTADDIARLSAARTSSQPFVPYE